MTKYNICPECVLVRPGHWACGGCTEWPCICSPIHGNEPYSTIILTGKADRGGEFIDVVKEYVSKVETGSTEEWCKCEWALHPDDVNVQSGQCRECRNSEYKHPLEGQQCEQFRPRRMRRKDDHPECPVHTKEGFLLGFVNYIKETVNGN